MLKLSEIIQKKQDLGIRFSMIAKQTDLKYGQVWKILTGATKKPSYYDVERISDYIEKYISFMRKVSK